MSTLSRVVPCGQADFDAGPIGAGSRVGSRRYGSGIERVVVISDDSVESGGAAGIALASIRMLRSRGIPVTLLTGDAGENPELAEVGAQVVALGARDLLTGPRVMAALRGLYNPAAASMVADWIDRYDTLGTVYHLHNWHKVLSPSVLVPLAKVASRLVCSLHDYFLVCPNGGYSHFPRNEPCELRPMSAACLVSNCDKRHFVHKAWRTARHLIRMSALSLARTQATMLAVHDGMVAFMERGGIPRRNIRVLRNPVTPWSSVRIQAECNHNVFFVGRLEQDKGADVLARVCARVGAPLTMIGGGTLTDDIRATMPGAELMGRLPADAVSRAVSRARMLVMPTRCRETFGLVAAEAAMSGIPVVVSQLAPISGDLVRLRAGVSCNAGDEDGLAETIRWLLADDAAIARMSLRGFESARTLAPDAGAWCDELIETYREILSKVDADRGRAQPVSTALMARRI